MPVILATWEANSLQDPISKVTRAKWTEGVAQVVESLLCKHKAQFKLQSYQNTYEGVYYIDYLK
jgi:hypothetical protein